MNNQVVYIHCFEATSKSERQMRFIIQPNPNRISKIQFHNENCIIENI